jgi:hypothetical protein
MITVLAFSDERRVPNAMSAPGAIHFAWGFFYGQNHTFQPLEKDRQHSAEFRHALDNILTAAKEKKNLDSAALAWTKTTLSCIECHRWVHNTLVAR